MIGKQERLFGDDRLRQIALELAILDIVGQRAQFLRIGRPPPFDFILVGVKNWQFCDAQREPRLGVARIDRQRALEFRRCLVVAVEVDEDLAAVIIGIGIVGIERQSLRIDFEGFVEAIERAQNPAAIVAGV